uniref:Uncharacterized protein n=1 Tax=Romanomermis culicivorax TaxID=13658 RepID=A0A915I8X7_ROMCU
MENNLRIFAFVGSKDERFSIDLLLLGYKSLKPKEISQMPLEQMLGNNLIDSDHSVELHSIPSNKDVFFFIKDTRKSFSLKNLMTTIGYIYPIEALDHFTQNEPIAKAGYMQGFVFKSIPDSYYTKLRESPLPMVSFNDGVLSICLPSVVEPNEFAMFNFGRKNQAAHRLLFGTKNEDLIIH